MKIFSYAFLLISLFGLLPAAAQDCVCIEEFNFTVRYFEQNHPGYQTSIKPTAELLAEYQEGVNHLRKEIKAKQPEESCIFYLERYLRLLRDNHISVEADLSYIRSLDAASPETLQAFKKSNSFTRHETLDYDSAALVARLQALPADAVEGIYTNGTAHFAIFKDATASRDYVGVMLDGDPELWPANRLKFTLRQVEGDLYELTLYMKYYDKLCRTVQVKDGRIPMLGFKKETREKRQADQLPFEFRELNARTNYLRLSSFDGKLYTYLDSLYRQHERTIQSKPNLIIDLRDNGGGSEACFFGIIPYVYSRPIDFAIPEYYVTSENIRRYEENLALMEASAARYGENAINIARKRLQAMRAAEPGTFIRTGDDAYNTFVLDSVPALPAQVVILQNRGTASSAEAFILLAMQSDKVITMGENTGGYVGYGNVMTTTTPGGCYTLASTSTRYKGRAQYEYLGIPPLQPLEASDDWIGEALELLQQQ